METVFCPNECGREVKPHLFWDSSLCADCARTGDSQQLRTGLHKIWGDGLPVTPLEVHRAIAEFIGMEDIVPDNVLELHEHQIKKYLPCAFSLDSMAPAWDLLSDYPIYSENGEYLANFEHRTHLKEKGKTIQEAAGRITYLAIMEQINP